MDGRMLVGALKYQLYGRRRLRFTGALTHTIVVPPDDEGRPGETLLTPSRPGYIGELAVDGSRNDFSVLLGRRTFLVATCLGRVEERGSAWESARSTIDHLYNIGAGDAASTLTRTELAGEDAVKYVIRFRGTGSVLTEWKLVRDGWTMAVGILRHPDESSAGFELGLQSLATWRWL